jgi:thioredoxin-like negative regulator of GroEL
LNLEASVLIVCADWCGVCRNFKTIVKDFHDCRVAWVDLDDFEELPGSPEIETFPTVIVVKDTAVLFIGAIKPNKESLEGLISRVSDRAPVPECAELGRELCSFLIRKSF